MSSSAGGVISIVTFFWMTVSLPLKKLHKERSRAVTRNTAGPSFIPASFEETIVTFVCLTGGGYSFVKGGGLFLLGESATVTDFRPVPDSLISISIGARPRVSVSGVILTCGLCHSNLGTRQ